ncbi:hypothetical protein V3564_05525 [Bartonella sp. B12(2025)]
MPHLLHIVALLSLILCLHNLFRVSKRYLLAILGEYSLPVFVMEIVFAIFG